MFNNQTICRSLPFFIPWLLRPCQDAFVQKCKKRVESIEEHDLWVDGKFKSEKTMVDDGMDPSFDSNGNVLWYHTFCTC